MKKLAFFLICSILTIGSSLHAQSFDVGMLDKAMTMLGNGKQAESAGILKQATGLLTKETKMAKGDFGKKLGLPLQGLTSMLPALSKGTADVSKVQGLVSKVKMIVGAMGMSKMLDGGSLLGKGAAVAQNVGLLKSGLGTLGSGPEVSQITKSLDKVTKKMPKLGKTGFFANMAQKAISKKLGSSLGLLKGLI